MSQVQFSPWEKNTGAEGGGAGGFCKMLWQESTLTLVNIGILELKVHI